MLKKIYYKLRKKLIINVLQQALNKAVIRPCKIAMLMSLAETGNLICKICGNPINEIRQASCDHIIPISKGGDKWNVKNYQLAHKKCNCKKGNEEK